MLHILSILHKHIYSWKKVKVLEVMKQQCQQVYSHGIVDIVKQADKIKHLFNKILSYDMRALSKMFLVIQELMGNKLCTSPNYLESLDYFYKLFQILK